MSLRNTTVIAPGVTVVAHRVSIRIVLIRGQVAEELFDFGHAHLVGGVAISRRLCGRGYRVPST